MDATSVGNGAIGQKKGEPAAPGSGSEPAAIERRLIERRRAMTTAQAELLDLVSELEGAEPHPTGSPDAATWLTWNLGLSGRTARRWVRTARALRNLPALRQALATGVISLDQLEVVLKIATPDTEASLVDLARGAGSVDELRDLLASLDESNAPTPDQSPPPAWLRTWWQDDRLHLRGEVGGADGVLVERALLRLGAKAPTDPASGLFRDQEVRAGEALVQMASESVAADGDHDRATLVVHVSAEDVLAGRGDGWDAARRVFPIGELERLACDSRLQPALRDRSGVTVGVGRVTRKIPPWLRRSMESRDRGCRFPGCRRTRWLHGHHLVPWSQGGPTNLDNLVSLCGFHHRLIHRESWSIDGDPNHSLVFRTGFGEIFTPALGRFPPDWADELVEMIDGQARSRLDALAVGAPP